MPVFKRVKLLRLSAQRHARYMRAAIDVAERSKEQGGVAIGAILVSRATGEIVARGVSNVGVTHDPTSHAEVNCIRKQCKVLENTDLYDYVLYSTLEPCHMCLSCAAWARIPSVYFGAYRQDVDESLFDVLHGRSDEVEASRMNLRERRKMKVKGGYLRKECQSLLAGYHDRHLHDPR